MKKSLFLIFVLLFSQGFFFAIVRAQTAENKPDSAWLFAYAGSRNSGRSGLYFAWSREGREWHPIGPEYSFVRSDYGSWGTEKRMIAPFLFYGNDGLWHCIWSLNESDDVFAHASSQDLVYWGRQSYPQMKTGKNIIKPRVFFDKGLKNYRVIWQSAEGTDTTLFYCTTDNFKTWSATRPLSGTSCQDVRKEAVISGKTETGTLHKSTLAGN